MRVIKGSAEIPFVFSAHHASDDFGAYTDRCALTDLQRKAYSDYGTSQTVPQNGIGAVEATLSRGIVDLNRAPADAQQFAQYDFANPVNAIWKQGQQLSEAEKQQILQDYYETFHGALTELAESADSGVSIVVAWDNTAQKVIGNNEVGEPVVMPTIILSNQGDEELQSRADGQQTTCDPQLLKLIGDQLTNALAAADLPNDVHYNLVFKGKQIVASHTEWPNNPLRQSLQIEYSSVLTHNQETLEELPGRINLVRSVAEHALTQAFQQYRLLQ